MSEVHTYRTSARWTGRRARRRPGQVEAEGGAEPLRFSAPPEFQGEAGQWSPETLLLAAANTCFLTTFVAIAEFSKLGLAGVEMSAEAHLERVPGQGYRFTEMVLRPVIVLAHDADREKAARLLEKAEKSCIVARYLETPLRVEATLRTEAPGHGASPM